MFFYLSEVRIVMLEDLEVIHKQYLKFLCSFIRLGSWKGPFTAGALWRRWIKNDIHWHHLPNVYACLGHSEDCKRPNWTTSFDIVRVCYLCSCIWVTLTPKLFLDVLITPFSASINQGSNLIFSIYMSLWYSNWQVFTCNGE